MIKLKSESFFKLALRFGTIFFVLVFSIEILFSTIKNMSFSTMLELYFYNGNYIFFFKRLVVMAVLYGLFMAGYYKFIKKD